jgi:hypothetical protein
MAGSAAASETAALVLVDRCLDLVTPLSHADHVLDQIYGTLQRRCAADNPTVRCFTVDTSGVQHNCTWESSSIFLSLLSIY